MKSVEIPVEKWSRWQGAVFAGLALLFILGGMWLVVLLGMGAAPFLSIPGLNALLSAHWQPLAGHFGILPMVVGSVLVTLLALGLAIPFALGIAVSVQFGLAARLRAPAIDGLTVLTAVPSVVFGWWGLDLVVPTIRQVFGGPGFSVLAAAIVLATMLIPTLGLLFRMALEAVPTAWVEGSLALGATEDQTLWHIIFRCQAGALGRAVMMAVARAMGETMAVQMVIGGQPLWPHSLTAPGATLTTTLLTDMAVFPPGVAGHAAIDALALALLVLMGLWVYFSERWGGI